VIPRYILLAVWPHPLVFDYGPCLPGHPAGAWPCAALLALLVAASALALGRRPAAGFAACGFFLILAPTSSVIPVVGQSMAENRMYLPLAGIVALVAGGAFALLGRASLPILAAAALCLGFLSVLRNRDYSTELGIWSDTVSKEPANARAHGNLGRILARLPGRLDDAIREYSEAARLDPGAAEVHLNLGNLWFRAPGHMDDAVAQYRDATRLRPDDANAHFDLACGLAAVPGRLDEAVAEFGEALRLRPGFTAAHVNLGNALARIPGRSTDALRQYGEALRERPELAEAHFNMALVLLKMPGHGDEARAHLREVLRLEPGNEDARALLAESASLP